MSSADKLIWASVYLSGPYLNEVDREVTYTHEVVASQKKKATQLLYGLNLVARSIGGQEILARGSQAVKHAGLDRMDELDMQPEFVAQLALSQLHPKWVLDSRPRRVYDMAQLLYMSRAIAQSFHEIELGLEQAR
jgi:hypothetical protein